MANERITENIVRDILREQGYYSEPERIFVEEQASVVAEIKRCLRDASKRGTGQRGAPEFIISSPQQPTFALVVECKADTANHESANLDCPEDYAVDGAIHYAGHLSKSYNVIAVAVSGQNRNNLKVSCFVRARGSRTFSPLVNLHGSQVKEIIPFDEFLGLASHDVDVEDARISDLMSASKELHDFMYSYGKLNERQKPHVVGGTLLALKNDAFRASYSTHKAKRIPGAWLSAIDAVLDDAEIPDEKRRRMVDVYKEISQEEAMGQETDKHPRGPLFEIINLVERKVYPFVTSYFGQDVVGQFYGEFLKYTGGDRKALGIVLTPQHISELFAVLAGVTKTSRVLDLCTGTSGYLISSMQKMISQASTKQDIENIKKNNLVGVELKHDMYTLAAANMIFRGDGKANLYHGSCFDDDIVSQVKSHSCDIGMLNPPYAQDEDDRNELDFVGHMLDCLSPGGIGVVIVPMSCAISDKKEKERLLARHTLLAVMSMPDELFYPVGATTCIMILRAGTPHETSDQMTWFGYWKDDGYVKTKSRGRCDYHRSWEKIRDRWCHGYRNKLQVPGESIMRRVSHDDEWCAEAYMDTDFSNVSAADFAHQLRDFAVHEVMKEEVQVSSNASTMNPGAWRNFKIGDLFAVKKGRSLKKLEQTPGSTPFVGASAMNNGVTDLISAEPIHPAGSITVAANGNSVGSSFFQPRAFWASSDVNVLIPKVPLGRDVSIFICSVLRKESYRYSYGRKFRLDLMRDTVIPLPVMNDGSMDVDYIKQIIQSLPFTNGLQERETICT